MPKIKNLTNEQLIMTALASLVYEANQQSHGYSGWKELYEELNKRGSNA